MARTRGKKRAPKYRSQMPTDPADIERIQRLDAAAKDRSRLANPNPTPRTDHYTQWLDQEHAVLDIIKDGQKQPRTWSENNSPNRAGGADRRM